MGSETPSVDFLGPGLLHGFQRTAARRDQPVSVPVVFLDAVEVRHDVFVREQGVPLENEFDVDDLRSCHWVVYAASGHADPGNTSKPPQGSTRNKPVGTLRLVPYPHEPHPEAGRSYWGGIVQGNQSAPDSPGHPLADRQTSFHDGKEPYVKLGRLAVLEQFRGQGLAGLLVKAALSWIRANPSYFDDAGAEPASGRNDPAEPDKPGWSGLVCVHAQELAAGAWTRWGFRVDEAMGSWFEEGISHVGMFLRLDVEQRA